MSADVDEPRVPVLPELEPEAGPGLEAEAEAEREPEPGAEPEPEAPAGPPAAVDTHRHGRRTRRILLSIAAVLGVVLLAGCWLGFRGYQAGRALFAAKDAVQQVQADISDGNTEAIKARLPEIQAQLGTASSATSDPVWRLAEHVPGIGRQLHAVRVVSVSLDDLARDALPAVGQIDAVLHAQEAPGTEGRIDLAPLVAAAPDIVHAAAAAHRAQDAIGALDTSRLVPQLAAPVAQLQGDFGQVTDSLDVGAQMATLLPSMLGADGPRTYLLVSLNSAELRSAGGIVGAFAVLHADDGAVDLVSQATTADLPGIADPILPLTPEELQVDTSRLGRWVQDAVMTPDFPRSAQLLAARWERDMGQPVDGVIATDPVAASYLLGATGPVALPDGSTVDASNVLQVLLRDTYLKYGDDGPAGDAFYTSVAATIFRAVGAGQGSSRDVVDALTHAGAEDRLRVWSAHPQEQKKLAATSVGAAFLTGPFPDAAGVFLNDGTAGKLDYYLTSKVTVEDLVCTGPAPTATVRLDLDYAPPADVATFPKYVTGWSGTQLPVGWLATNITAYAPVGAPLDAVRKDDGYVFGQPATIGGRNTQVVTSWLAPGAHETYRFQVPVHDGAVSVWTTPTLTSPGKVVATCG